MTAILTVQGLEKRFGTRRVLAGASFAVHERDRIGMIGANGAGKSTLLEIVVHRAMGGDDPALAPDAGLVTWKRDLALEYVAQEPALDPAATVGAVVARAGVLKEAYLVDGQPQFVSSNVESERLGNYLIQ